MIKEPAENLTSTLNGAGHQATDYSPLPIQARKTAPQDNWSLAGYRCRQALESKLCYSRLPGYRQSPGHGEQDRLLPGLNQLVIKQRPGYDSELGPVSISVIIKTGGR
ncbi:MAG: hypothetical protein PHU81_01820 [Acidobacteriota bacterium]|nr:hypothetical protein [Acidobacteriota bacterium]